MLNSGIKTINSAIDIFTKVEKKLEKGISLCCKETAGKTEKIADLNVQIASLDTQIGEIETSKKKAERVLGKVKEIIG